jgi:hypothetical protein
MVGNGREGRERKGFKGGGRVRKGEVGKYVGFGGKVWGISTRIVRY